MKIGLVMNTNKISEEQAHQPRNGRLLLIAGGLAFSALVIMGLGMTLTQGETMFLKTLIARIPGCGGLF